jgi:hypothetical protein
MNPLKAISKSTRLVLVGGLSAGAAMTAGSALAAATTPSASTATAATTSPSARPAPGGARPGIPGAPGAQGAPPARGGAPALGGPRPGGPGGPPGGTVTQISGTTLTLRTEEGTLTVTTTASTTFEDGRDPGTLASVAVGDVVHVRPVTPPAEGTTPGTGTIAAADVRVVYPELHGRITAIDGNVIHLTGHDGKLLTVTTTASTEYFSGRSASTAAELVVGAHMAAWGDQDSITHLTADYIEVRPA